MRERLRPYYPFNESEYRQFWQDARIILDTNVLLHFYRISSAARANFFQVLESVGARLWIPHRVGYEFLKNRPDVIIAQAKKYEDALDHVKQLRVELESVLNGFSTLSTEIPISLPNEIDGAIRTIDEFIATQRAKHAHESVPPKFEDLILEHLAAILGDRVGEPLTEEKRGSIRAEYDSRLKAGENVAGAHDSKKIDPRDKDAKYGDLIIWNEILDYAKIHAKSIIFVTSDAKEDWWMVVRGQRIGPQPDHVSDFWHESGQMNDFMTPDRFLERAQDFLGENVSQATIDEVQTAETESDGLFSLAVKEHLRSLLERRERLHGEISTTRGNLKRIAQLRDDEKTEAIRANTYEEWVVICARIDAIYEEEFQRLVSLHHAQRRELELLTAHILNVDRPSAYNSGA